MHLSRRLHAAFAVFFAVSAPVAFAGAPIGSITSLDAPTKDFLFRGLKEEHVIGPHFRILSDPKLTFIMLEIYLQSHRSEISDYGTPPDTVDIVVCLLHSHGHSGGPLMNDIMLSFCQKHLR